MKKTNSLIIEKTAENSKLSLALEGHIDSNTAPDLEKVLNGSLEGVTALVFDLSKVDYISSAGLRVLLSSHKKMSSKGSMKIKGVSDAIMEIFDITGFSDIFTIE